jgi:hypothetical protein
LSVTARKTRSPSSIAAEVTGSPASSKVHTRSGKVARRLPPTLQGHILVDVGDLVGLSAAPTEDCPSHCEGFDVLSGH